MGLGRLLEACQGYEEVALECSSKPTKYELQGPYGDIPYTVFLINHAEILEDLGSNMGPKSVLN